jgi:hypothetical protein
MAGQIDSIDRIQTMSDDELDRKLRITRSAASRAVYNGDRDFTAEIDYCYYFREAEIRHARFVAHTEWLAAQRRQA